MRSRPTFQDNKPPWISPAAAGLFLSSAVGPGSTDAATPIRPTPAGRQADNPATHGEAEKISPACTSFQLIGGRLNSVGRYLSSPLNRLSRGGRDARLLSNTRPRAVRRSCLGPC